ncbi:MAG: peptide deformylase [Actinomycetota bacterium]
MTAIPETTLRTGVVRPILSDREPVLLRPSVPVAPDDPALPADMADLAATLEDFRRRVGFGRGISAPQIGIGKRLITLNLGVGPMAVINPEIMWRSDETQTVWDDCLSVPDVLVRVERAASITVDFTDHDGRLCRWDQLPADLSELLQHEIDHLDGVLMTDLAATEGDIAPMSARAELIDHYRPPASKPPVTVYL